MSDEPRNSPPGSLGDQEMGDDPLQAYQAKCDEPPLQVLDFSDQPPIIIVSTVLRRLWLLDPASLAANEAVDAPGVKTIFKSFIFKMIKHMSTLPEPEKYDDDVWRSGESAPLLDPPLVMAGADEPPESNCSALSPWRQEAYRQYRHIFTDVQKIAKDMNESVGDFDGRLGVILAEPPEAGELQSEQQLRLLHDTFVYPVWVCPGCKVSVVVGDDSYSFSSDGSSWKAVLWIKGSQTLRVILDAPPNHDAVVAGAVLALGTCEPRKSTLGLERTSWPPAGGGENQMPGFTDDSKPAFYPEIDHLARAIFLKAGDSIDKCFYDELYDDSDEPEETKSESTPSLYLPLPTNSSTRVLIVEPGTTEDSLETRLSVVDLDQSPVYEAISYTWGSPTDKVPLACGDSSVMVPRNLELALRRIRRPDRRRILWADAVCINQDDISERSQQVSIMRHIFRAAKRVLVWLGPDDDMLAGKAFATTCTVVKSWRDTIGENKFLFLNYDKAFQELDSTEAEELRRQLDREGWTALRVMFEAPLFRRFWIIQELALAQSAVVIWGNHCISWGLVGVCAAWLLTKGWMFQLESSEDSSEDSSATGTSSSVAAFNAFLSYAFPLASRSAISGFSKLDLSAMLGATVEIFHSTDHRDRIYALLGMPFAGNDPSTDAFLVQPDYSRDVQDVYTEASRRMLQQDKHLRLLSSVQHPSAEHIGSDGYPSWVPRWDQAQLAEPLALRQESGYYANGGELFFPDENTFGEDGKSLFVRGLKCGSVIGVSKDINTSNIQHLSSLDEWKEHAEGAFLILSQLVDVERQFRSTWSSNVENSTLVGFNNPDAQETAVREGLRLAATTGIPGQYGLRESTEIITGERSQTDHLNEILLSWRERNTWQRLGSQVSELQARFQNRASEDENPGAASIRTGILFSAVTVMIGRKVFHCDDGSVGIGPEAMKEGDVVAVLFGGIVPFVLRPLEQDRWQLVGECFVPGLMQGEAVEKAGLLMPGSYNRREDGTGILRLHPFGKEEPDPRFHRNVGDCGIGLFEIR